MVVVDDKSTDDLERTIQSFDDPRIRFSRQENRGGGAARNRGIDLSLGRFVAFLDSDDQFLPGHLNQMKHLLAGLLSSWIAG
jgi:glycosyltransferase involved in cell wall biosynthesis